MAGSIQTTAATIRAILCFIDANQTPKVAFDNDHFALPLIEKMKQTVGDLDGSTSVFISFSYEEEELQRQFVGVCSNIQTIFGFLSEFEG